MRQIFPPKQTAQIKLENTSRRAYLLQQAPKNCRDSIVIIVVLSARVPGQPLLIELGEG